MRLITVFFLIMSYCLWQPVNRAAADGKNTANYLLCPMTICWETLAPKEGSTVCQSLTISWRLSPNNLQRNDVFSFTCCDICFSWSEARRRESSRAWMLSSISVQYFLIICARLLTHSLHVKSFSSPISGEWIKKISHSLFCEASRTLTTVILTYVDVSVLNRL